MAVAAPARPAAADLLGVFTPEVFAAHLASQAALPSWWLERKRSAYSRFESLPMPRRTDESWRFSNIAGINLGGFSPAADAPAPGNRRAPEALAIAPAATLSFLNGRLSASTPLPADLAARGVVASAISGAIARHPGLLREHFMAQPQKLGSAKFAALHEAFIQDGAFILIPRGVEIDGPIVVVHEVSGAGAAVFPHTLVIAEDNARATVVDHFVSADLSRRYACHGAKIAYAAARELVVRRERPVCGPRREDSLRGRAVLVPGGALAPVQLHGRAQERPRPVAQPPPGRQAGEARVAQPAPGARRLLGDARHHHRKRLHGVRPADAPDPPGAEHQVGPPLQERASRPVADHLLGPDHRRSRRPEDGRLPEQPQPDAERRGGIQLAPRPRDPGERRPLHPRRDKLPDRPRAGVLPEVPWDAPEGGGRAADLRLLRGGPEPAGERGAPRGAAQAHPGALAQVTHPSYHHAFTHDPRTHPFSRGVRHADPVRRPARAPGRHEYPDPPDARRELHRPDGSRPLPDRRKGRRRVRRAGGGPHGRCGDPGGRRARSGGGLGPAPQGLRPGDPG